MVMTKDERFLLCLYREAAKLSDDADAALNRYYIGVLAKLQPKGVNAICQQLVRGNFIKKDGEEAVFLLPHGLKLAKELDANN